MNVWHTGLGKGGCCGGDTGTIGTETPDDLISEFIRRFIKQKLW